MKAVLFVGGWQGHKPTDFAQWCSDLLMADGYVVEIYDTLVPLEQPETLSDVNVIIPLSLIHI